MKVKTITYRYTEQRNNMKYKETKQKDGEHTRH